MLLRILTVHVNPDRVADWLRFTRDIGFPGMLAQPGCRAIRRLRVYGTERAFRIMTEWDSFADLQRFRASAAMRELTASAAGLTIPPAEEMLFEVVEDPND